MANILVLDRDRSMRGWITDMLEVGHVNKVWPAEDIESAKIIARCLSNRLDLLITDVNARGFSESDVLSHVHVECPFARIIVITGHDHPEQYNGYPALRRPFSVWALLDMVQVTLAAQWLPLRAA